MEWETKFQGSWKYLVTKKITEQNEKAQNRINFEKKKKKKQAWTVGPIYRCDFGKI